MTTLSLILLIPVIIDILLVIAFIVLIIIRMLWIWRVLVWSVGTMGRLHRDPKMPPYMVMMLKLWVWDPLKITNDVQMIEDRKNLTGAYAHLHPDYPETLRKTMEELVEKHRANPPKESNWVKAKVIPLDDFDGDSNG